VIEQLSDLVIIFKMIFTQKTEILTEISEKQNIVKNNHSSTQSQITQ
jgi:hypothetical protein